MVWNYEDGLSSLWSHVLVFCQWSNFHMFYYFWFDSWSRSPWMCLWSWLREEILFSCRRTLVSHHTVDSLWISFCMFPSLHIFMFLSLSEFLYMPFLLWSPYYLNWLIRLPLRIQMLWGKLIQLAHSWFRNGNKFDSYA